MSVAVNDLNVTGAFIGPDEADSPLLVDSYAVLARSIILQRLKAVARRQLQIVKNLRVGHANSMAGAPGVVACANPALRFSTATRHACAVDWVLRTGTEFIFAKTLLY